jgi:hypothetical protein
VFWFPLQLLSVNLLLPIWTERDIIKNVHLCWCKVPLFLPDFNKTLFFWNIFSKKSLNTIFHENRYSKIRVVPYGETDIQTDGRHDEAEESSSQFCKRASNSEPERSVK